MELKIVILLSALGLACGASIQDPFIHDSVEDQIAMESGARRSVVVAPPGLQEADEPDADGDIDAADAADAAADVAAAEEEEKAEAEDKPAVDADSFEILLNDAPSQRPQLSPFRPTFGGFALRPSPVSQMALLSQLQYPSLGGYRSPVIVLQPIFVPVPMSADSEKEDATDADKQDQLPAYLRRQVTRRRPAFSLLDILQQGYYGF